MGGGVVIVLSDIHKLQGVTVGVGSVSKLGVAAKADKSRQNRNIDAQSDRETDGRTYGQTDDQTDRQAERCIT